MVFENAFHDFEETTVDDDVLLDSQVNWVTSLPPHQARELVNKFYHCINTEDVTDSRERFSAVNDVYDFNFKCVLKKFRCLGTKRDNSRCTRRLAAGLPLCFQHTLSYFGVKLGRTTLISPSNGDRLSMIGVIACRRGRPRFEPNDVICPYIGEIRSEEELDNIYPDEVAASYTLTLGRPDRPNIQHVDSACLRGVAGYINSAPRNARLTQQEKARVKNSGGGIATRRVGPNGVVAAKYNCRLAVLVTSIENGRAIDPQPWVVAMRTIRNGEELFLNMEDYMEETEHDRHRTINQNLKRAPCRL